MTTTARMSARRGPAALLLAATAAMAAPAWGRVQPVLSGVAGPVAAGQPLTVQLSFLNDGTAAEAIDAPARIDAVATAGAGVGATRLPLVLERSGPQPSAPLAPGGFARIAYVARLPAGLPAGAVTLSAPSLGASALALDITAPATAYVAAATGPAAVPTGAVVAPTFESADPDTGNLYVDRLSVYDPIYAVFGAGSDTDGRIQISFKYRLFAAPEGGARGGLPGLEGLHFGYTQRLFWDVGAKSTPFRNVDYMPELFYLVPSTPVRPNLWLGGQAGIRHESNGRDGLASRSLNYLYAQPVASFMAGDYRVSVGPRAWVYFGSLEDNPDVRRYRGNTGLFAEIGQDEGFRLTTNTRFNPSSGKGSINADLSYPLGALGVERLGLYVFGQGFAGYGENLLDYRRKTTRLRIGIGLVR